MVYYVTTAVHGYDEHSLQTIRNPLLTEASTTRQVQKEMCVTFYFDSFKVLKCQAIHKRDLFFRFLDNACCFACFK